MGPIFGTRALIFHGPNEERRAGGASPLWQAGAAAEGEIGTCLPRGRGADPRAAGKRQSKSSGYRETDAGTVCTCQHNGTLGE